ncbi:MAG: hypothetical protein ACKV2U_27565 [Bryobacteraceae bacterium]
MPLQGSVNDDALLDRNHRGAALFAVDGDDPRVCAGPDARDLQIDLHEAAEGDFGSTRAAPEGTGLPTWPEPVSLTVKSAFRTAAGRSRRRH